MLFSDSNRGILGQYFINMKEAVKRCLTGLLLFEYFGAETDFPPSLGALS